MNAQTVRTGAIFLAVVILSFIGAGPALCEEGWTLHFEELFKRNGLGKDWAVLDGQFKTVYDAPTGTGTLYAKGEAVILRRFPGDVRVEMGASSANPCDLTIMLATNERGSLDGYFLGFGSNNNSISKILRARKKVAVSPVLIKRGKQHKIVAEKAGKVVTLGVDGKEIMRFEDPSPLEGPAHQMVGIYFWNAASVDYVRVYGRKGKAPVKLAALPKAEKTPAPVKPAAAPDSVTNLIVNPSFEATMAGKWPRFPVNWVPEYSGVGDGVVVIKDPAGAHGGERFLRLSGKGPWMKVHSLGPFVRNVQKGKRYEFRAWARSSGEGPAAIEFHPSQKRFPLTDRWQEFAVTWKAPDTARYPDTITNPAKVPPRTIRLDYTGFYLKAYGGVDIDDVSAWEAERGVPAELQMAKTRFERIAPSPGWITEPGKPPYRERIWLELTELTGKPAGKVPVGVSVAEAFGVLNHDFVSQQKIRVVDGSTGKTVPSSILEVGLEPGIQSADHIVFLADVPAGARTIYYLYLRDREPLSTKPLDFYRRDYQPPALALSTPPEAFRAYNKDAPRLTVENVKIERLGTVVIEKREDNRVAIEVTALPGSTVTGRASSPDGKKELEIGFEKKNRGSIREGAFFLGKNPEKGIWRVAIDLGAGLKAESAFVVDAGIWAGGNLRVIHSNDPPRAGRGTARILAARGERESFQFAVAADRALSQVALTGGELRQVGGKGRIPAASWKLDRVEEVFVGIIYPSPELRFVDGRFINVGNYPDPILPWRRHDIEAGKQRVCLATLRVPRGIPGGDYSGSITATAADGTELVLPVELRVYDFDMPERPSFTVMISGVLGYVRVAGDRGGKFGSDFRYYHVFDREAGDELAEFIAQNWMTPSLTGNPFCANAIPWTYDQETRTAKLDFTRFDANAEILIDKYGVDFISIPWTPGRGSISGWIFTYDPVDNWPSAGWGLGPYEKPPGRIVRKLDTAEGLEMLEAAARELGKHLEEKGWLDRVSIYIFDEAESRVAHKAIENAVPAIRRGHPKLKMWGAGYGKGWQSYSDSLSAFTGGISPEVRKRFREKGIRYFGRYNQTINILAIPRAIALYGYSEDWDGYYHHETTSGQDAWVNPEPPTFTNAFIPTYVGGGALGWNLLAGFIYHWPEDELNEPLPEGKTRAWASSLRIEGFRESVEDAEYFTILEDLAEKSPAGSRTRGKHRELEARLKRWLDKGGYIDDKQRYYNHRLDEKELAAIRQAVCEAVEEAR